MIRLYIDGQLDSFNRPHEGPIERSPLHRVLEQQLFKLVPWKVAYEKINYRRFFYVNDFIALHTEDPQVFERIHRKTLDLTRAGVFTRLRIDHVDGRVKLFLIHRGLHARGQNKELFDVGDYLPASVTGSRAQHIVAFFRQWQSDYALTVVPRFLASLRGPGESPMGREVWQDTRIRLPANAPSDWRDAVTGNVLTARDKLSVGDILREFPVAILVARPS